MHQLVARLTLGTHEIGWAVACHILNKTHARRLGTPQMGGVRPDVALYAERCRTTAPTAHCGSNGGSAPS